jgi:hypothetical protein
MKMPLLIRIKFRLKMGGIATSRRQRLSLGCRRSIGGAAASTDGAMPVFQAPKLQRFMREHADCTSRLRVLSELWRSEPTS